jgi:hypothetical protein
MSEPNILRKRIVVDTNSNGETKSSRETTSFSATSGRRKTKESLKDPTAELKKLMRDAGKSDTIEQSFGKLRIQRLGWVDWINYQGLTNGRYVVMVILVWWVLPTLVGILISIFLKPWFNLTLPDNPIVNAWMQNDLWKEVEGMPVGEKGGEKIKKMGEKFLDETILFLILWFGKPFFQWLFPCFFNQKVDQFDATNNREKLAWTRLNFSLNMLQYNGEEPKITMRTINEDQLTVIFADKMDAWIFSQITNTKELAIPGEVAPFLSLSVIASDIQWKTVGTNQLFKDVVRKCRDQVVNRVSSLFGLGYVFQDLGMEVNTHEYIFGVTYEDQTDARNRKVRILLMRKDQLNIMKQLVKERKEFEHDRIIRESESHDIKTQLYAKDRLNNLCKMHDLYNSNKKDDSDEKKDGDISAVRGTVIGSVYISAQGQKIR